MRLESTCKPRKGLGLFASLFASQLSFQLSTLSSLDKSGAWHCNSNTSHFKMAALGNSKWKIAFRKPRFVDLQDQRFVFLLCIRYKLCSKSILGATCWNSGGSFNNNNNIYIYIHYIHYIYYWYTKYTAVTIQYNTIQYNTIQYNTIKYNTIQYNAMQWTLFHEGNTITKLLYSP